MTYDEIAWLDENAWARSFAARTCLDKDLPELQGRHWRLANVQVFHGALSVLDQDRLHVRHVQSLRMVEGQMDDEIGGTLVMTV